MPIGRRPDRRARWPRLPACGLALAVLAACAQEGDPRVGMERLKADLVFGAPKSPPVASVPGANPPVPDDVPVEQVRRRLETATTEAEEPAPPRSTTTTVPRPRRPQCPPAAVNAFPATEAGRTVTARPTEGVSFWRRSGTRHLNGMPFPLGGFEPRAVRRVADATAVFDQTAPQEKFAYTYEWLRVLDGGLIEVHTFKVNNAPVAQDPEAGLVLKSTKVYSPDGVLQDSFEPVTGLLYLPLPVVPGTPFESRAVDPRSGRVVTSIAKVIGRERVDACGEIVDGWAVEANVETTGSQPAAVTLRYVVAPQFGAVLVGEHVRGQLPSGLVDATFLLAQVVPAPLPENLK